MKKKLCKSRKNRIIDGVCAGIAEYFNIDATLIRLVAVAFCLLKGAGILFYIIACILMPAAEGEEDFGDEDVENLKSANVDSEERKSDAKKEKNAPHSDEEFDSYFKK